MKNPGIDTPPAMFMNTGTEAEMSESEATLNFSQEIVDEAKKAMAGGLKDVNNKQEPNILPKTVTCKT